MNIAIFFLSIAALTGTPNTEFVKPTNLGEKNIKIMKPINFVDHNRKSGFVRVSKKPVNPASAIDDDDPSPIKYNQRVDQIKAQIAGAGAAPERS